jgi:nicotinamidase-related amidase
MTGLAMVADRAYPDVMRTSPTPTLDPGSALVLIDLQAGIVAGPKAHAVEVVVANAARLATAFRDQGRTVVLVNVAGGAPGRVEQARPPGPPSEGFDELVPDLGAAPGDLRVTKRRWGAFSEPSLDPELRARGVTQIVLGGIATSIGVESTARQAHELGYNVTLVIDAMTDFSLESHLHAVERIFPRIGERVTTDTVISLLDVGGGS